MSHTCVYHGKPSQCTDCRLAVADRLIMAAERALAAPEVTKPCRVCGEENGHHASWCAFSWLAEAMKPLKEARR